MSVLTSFKSILVFTVLAMFGVVSESVIAMGAEAQPQILNTNVRIFDGNSPALIEGQNVLIEGKLIKSVGKDLKAKPGATVSPRCFVSQDAY